MTAEHKLGTDEAFLQLMTVSGNSLLKLFGMPNAQTAHYQFRAIVLKDKQLKPDVEFGVKYFQSKVFLRYTGVK